MELTTYNMLQPDVIIDGCFSLREGNPIGCMRISHARTNQKRMRRWWWQCPAGLLRKKNNRKFDGGNKRKEKTHTKEGKERNRVMRTINVTGKSNLFETTTEQRCRPKKAAKLVRTATIEYRTHKCSLCSGAYAVCSISLPTIRR